MSDDKKVVWILGAGFSRSLGAPLLGDLFTYESKENVCNTYGIVGDLKRDFNAIVYSYYMGLKNEDLISEEALAKLRERSLGKNRRHLWEHSEDFLERLDIAADSDTDSSDFILFKTIFGEVAYQSYIDSPNKLKQLSATARKLLAAECSVFLVDNPIRRERWIPYRKWASNLGSGETVLSFNYDRVLEKLQNWLGDDNRIVIPTPEEVQSDNYNKDMAVVYKLHGSVTWFYHDDDIRNLNYHPGWQHEEYPFLSVNSLAIATPGQVKQDSIKTTQLKHLWGKANTAIKEADAIVFLGYRFPPIDALSRDEILFYIKNAEKSAVYYTVLGSNINHEDFP